MANTRSKPARYTGRRLRKDGYVDVWAPRHPLARRDGYVFEHRKVAWDTDLMTDPAMEVHHRNHVKCDNRPENLEVKSGSSHALDHAEERGWVRNQYGRWAVKPRENRVSAPRPERECELCGKHFSHERRRDARFCSSNCRITAWKRRAREQDRHDQQVQLQGQASRPPQ